jgi:hypothetical protein
MRTFVRARSNPEQAAIRTRRAVRGRRATTAAALLVLVTACAPSDPMAQRTFDAPEEAANALMDAIRSDDAAAILSILGPEYEAQLVSPDWNAEREVRQKIAAAAAERQQLQAIDDGEMELIVGVEEWPVPFPLVRDEDGAWRFDTAEGIEVILDRRIGRNELSAIAIVNAYVDAQIQYARADRDGDDVLEFAQRLASSPGEKDGLYWEAAPGEAESPFGPLIQEAERYLDTLAPGDPIRGYYFELLTRQGENAPGGRYDYVINGNMIAGFALVAYPADYGNSGVMTFVVNHRGVIQQKDLGAFDGMERYDPDDTWVPAEADAGA